MSTKFYFYSNRNHEIIRYRYFLFLIFCSNSFECKSYTTLFVSARAHNWHQATPGNGGCSKDQPSMESRSLRGFCRLSGTQVDKYSYIMNHNGTERQCTVVKPNGLKFLKHFSLFVASWSETAFVLTGQTTIDQDTKGDSRIIGTFSTAGMFITVILKSQVCFYWNWDKTCFYLNFPWEKEGGHIFGLSEII